MKKTYSEPRAHVIVVGQHIPLAASIDEGINGNSDFYYGGGSAGDVEGRTKQHHSIWDDEW
ncbi:MAG: hypothetical protein J6W03_07195 [Bacteroidaceae bacterium]|nr:hypothetical protein [Bacteroidaceae bacterium]